ncbi:cell wall protein [Stigmatella sp. ncwal1]|uniref:Cell wall protein n=1 Tax=Stigmatella ashevillensis TaxID=2995309 RepID=A0ABT5DES7_9BACT|nr:cell wall protein [Stigmatella ashevillena]MDC0712165.1 cell wall protein [Stigmatella ashevillena]
MSVDKAFREMIRNEIEVQLKPLRAVVARLEAGTADLESLRSVVERLAPVAQAISPLFGAQAPKTGKRPPGRPPRSAAPAAAVSAPASTGKRRGRKPSEDGARVCAIRGCGSPSRTKGYCAAHYQKLRMLTKTNRRPNAWVDYAPPNSVEDVKLPRGRAAAKALAEAAQSGGAS